MEAKLEFNLDEPSDREAHDRCIRALDMALVLWNLRQYLSDRVRHVEGSEREAHTLEHLNAELADKGVDLDRLMS